MLGAATCGDLFVFLHANHCCGFFLVLIVPLGRKIAMSSLSPIWMNDRANEEIDKKNDR